MSDDAVAAARPHILEEAARVVQSMADDAGLVDAGDAAAAIRAAKET